MAATNEQQAALLELKGLFDQDAAWAAAYAKLRERRQQIVPQIVDLLKRFLAGEVRLAELRSTWDVKTRTVWDGFGLKGMSSAMFLNMLAKHLPDQQRTAAELRAAMPFPSGEQDGRTRMGTFKAYLVGAIEAGHATRQKIHVARTPYFISAFWHLQDPEAWPIFYQSARQVLQRRGLYTPKSQLVEDYFAFRDAYLSAMAALKVGSWDLEQLCWFDIERHKASASKTSTTKGEAAAAGGETGSAGGVPVAAGGAAEDAGDVPEPVATSPHTHAQWLLASLGKAFGCKVWVASNDHAKAWNGQQLGELSIASLPNLGMGLESQKIVKLIDVLWLKGANQVVAAFEIEHSTSVYSGLLRMSDLTVLSPNLLFPLYIVAPAERLEKVRGELSRPSFQALELHQRCGFFSAEALVAEADHMKKWAKDPAAIDQLAEYVEDVVADEGG